VSLHFIDAGDPGQNGHAVRGDRTYTEGFDEITSSLFAIFTLNRELRDGELVHNTLRPHQPSAPPPPPSSSLKPSFIQRSCGVTNKHIT
jgi:hypothetical protein